jgi:Cu2+-exporting ATPase
VFDKTGTLSSRRVELVGVEACGALSGKACLEIAARLEAGSLHPLAYAIRSAAGDPGAAADDISNVPGEGVEGTVDGVRYRLGRPGYAIAPDASDRDDLVLATADGVVAHLRLRESLRDDAIETVAALRSGGCDIEILSGDAPARVAAAAQRLHVDVWHARRSPADKLARLAELRAAGHRVAVVGDGVNDAPALAGADLAIAIGGGAELAQSSADIVLADDRLGGLVAARDVAVISARIMRQNMLWALAYNAASVPLAALGFVSPLLAALGMSISSIAVIANSLRIALPRPPSRDRSADSPALPRTAPA